MKRLLGVNPTQTHTTAQFALGTETRDPRVGAYAGNTIRYVKAGATIAAGDALMVDMADTDEPHALQPTAANGDCIVAIAHVAIANNEYGWVTVSGSISAVSSTAVGAVGLTLVADSVAGQLIALTLATATGDILNVARINRVQGGIGGVGIVAIDSQSASGAIDVMINGG
jgi:hypothetical protein